MKNRFLAIVAICFILMGCGATNNISITTYPGYCPTAESALAPYCMSVMIQNAGGSTTGQNYISSTNYPIQITGLTINGATNLNTPANNAGSMDPNGCTTSQINPGSQCTFYMQLTGEQFPVTGIESIDVTIDYCINNSFLGGLFNQGCSSGSSTNFTVYEITNLYTVMSNSSFNGAATQNQGFLWQYNAVCSTLNPSNPIVCNGRIESSDYVNSIAVDNSTFGYLYLGGNNGIYQYGVESITGSISPGGLTGANNLFAVGSTLYATGSTTGGVGVWSYSLPNLTWNNSNQALYGATTVFVGNANAISPSSVMYFVGQTNGNNSRAIYSCSSNGSGSTSNCTTEGVSTPNPASSLGFISGTNPPYTGLYVGTSQSLLAEKGTTPSPSATWESLPAISSSINTIITDGGSNLFAGDNLGNIWLINGQAPITPTTFVAASQNSGPILGMKYDGNGSTLYFTAGSNNNYTIYSCPFAESSATTPSCGTPKPLVTGLNGIFAGMGIGSQLIDETQ